MLRKLTSSLTVLGCLIAFTAPADAAISLFDQDVTPDVIFGSGNANGGFTVDRANGVELGLRAKLRFDSNNQPQNTFNSNGAGSYTFQAGTPPVGFGFAANSPTTPVWNFEWTVNTDYDDQNSTGVKLDDLTYEISLDADPGPGTTFLTFDPITPSVVVPFWDHSIGNNSTTSADDTKGNAANYAGLIADNNVAQNSWNYEFFNSSFSHIPPNPLSTFDPSVRGVYTIVLTAFDGGVQVARTSIDINVVPEPASLLVWSLLGVVGIVAGSRRRRRTA